MSNTDDSSVVYRTINLYSPGRYIRSIHTYTHYMHCPFPLNCPLIQIVDFPLKSIFLKISLMPFFVYLLCYCLHIVSTTLSICCFHPHSTELGEVIHVAMGWKVANNSLYRNSVKKCSLCSREKRSWNICLKIFPYHHKHC